MRPGTEQRLRAWRIALAGWLAGWFVNGWENVRLFVAGWERPIAAHPLFPGPMRNGWLALGLFVVPLAGFAGFRSGEIRWLRMISGALILAALGLLGHVCTYNDATYTTAFWSALWLFWWAGRVGEERPGAERHAIALGQGMVGLCFLGGFVGKLTPEYWSGEALYHLYVMQKPYFPFDWMRECWAESESRAAAAWLARAVIVTEGLLSTLILWPTRWALVATLGVMGGMTLMAHIQILSVLAPLLGVMLACAFLADLSRQGEDPQGGGAP